MVKEEYFVTYKFITFMQGCNATKSFVSDSSEVESFCDLS